MNSTKNQNNQSFRKQPFWFKSLNSLWKSSYAVGTKIKIEKDDLIKTSRKMTGLHDLGKDFYDEPLERLLISVNEEANLHPIGRFITKQRFISLLNNRLRAEYYFKRYPEILQQELYPAWIIIGLQRTGTTKLQRLLATDPDNRVIPSWEVINPIPIGAPPPNPLPFRGMGEGREVITDKRINVAKNSVTALKLMSPGFFAIHPIEVFEPEEDILLLDISFMSTTPEAMMNVPSYAGWLENTDQSLAYAYAVKILKFLQWAKPAKRWVLKTPHHLEFPDLIEKHFHEVHFFWTHRSIYESVPSFLSMVTYNQMIFSDDVDTQRIARHWVRKTGYMLEKALDYRAKDDNITKFHDIIFQDLVTDSICELSKIYKIYGGLTSDHINCIRDHEKEYPHHKHGVHKYSLTDFGLTEGDIDRHTGHYQDFLVNLWKGKGKINDGKQKTK
jgi:Sulfotransferase family